MEVDSIFPRYAAGGQSKAATMSSQRPAVNHIAVDVVDDGPTSEWWRNLFTGSSLLLATVAVVSTTNCFAIGSRRAESFSFSPPGDPCAEIKKKKKAKQTHSKLKKKKKKKISAVAFSHLVSFVIPPPLVSFFSTAPKEMRTITNLTSNGGRRGENAIIRLPNTFHSALPGFPVFFEPLLRPLVPLF